jgi:hypothetical protein
MMAVYRKPVQILYYRYDQEDGMANQKGRGGNQGGNRGGNQNDDNERGFAAMDDEEQREIARKGGVAVVEKYGPEHMAEIDRKGGEAAAESRRNEEDEGDGGGGNQGGGRSGGGNRGRGGNQGGGR